MVKEKGGQAGRQAGRRALVGIDWSFLPRTLLDKPIDDTLSQPGILLIPPLKQLIAIVAQKRRSARSRPARFAPG